MHLQYLGRGAYQWRRMVAALAIFLAGTIAFATTSLAAPVSVPSQSAHIAQDCDGDGIPDALDPDDGCDDSPPPMVGPDPGADSDGDGIPDVLDPDDNNDGITDDGRTVAPGVTPPSSSGPGPGASTAQPPASGAQGGGGAVITAFPATGSGTQAGAVPGWAAIVALLAVAACVAAGSRHQTS